MAKQDLRKLEFHGDAEIDFDNIAFIILSSVLASIALLSHSVPVLIGAMVLAPTFDPLIAIPFGMVNRDWKLFRQGVVGSLVLLTVSVVSCFLTVWLVLLLNLVPASLTSIGPDMVTERLVVGWHSVAIALVAGAGGALASASNRRESIMGVVMALALVPALAAAAIAVHFEQINGLGGIKLFAVNVLGIIVAGFVILEFRRKAGEAGEEVEKRIKH